MDELFDLLKEFARLIPLNTADKELEGNIRKSWADRLETIAKKLVTLGTYQGPIPGGPVDEDIPPPPSHWERNSGPAPEEPEAPVAPAPAPATPTLVSAAPEAPDIESALANLAPAPGVTGLPATTLSEQEAAAPPPS